MDALTTSLSLDASLEDQPEAARALAPNGQNTETVQRPLSREHFTLGVSACRTGLDPVIMPESLSSQVTAEW
jgi:hypothetical protein